MIKRKISRWIECDECRERVELPMLSCTKCFGDFCERCCVVAGFNVDEPSCINCKNKNKRGLTVRL